MTQVVQSEGFSQLDDSLAKQFIQKAANRKAFKTWSTRLQLGTQSQIIINKQKVT